MPQIYKKLLPFVLSICFLHANAQDTTNRGKEFWVGYGHHQFMEGGSNSQDMVLYISTDQTAIVTISIAGTNYLNNYIIPANTVVQTVAMPKGPVQDARLYNASGGSEGLFTKGIHITSDVPVVVYAHIYGSVSSGATMLIPVEAWGGVYTSVNTKQSYQPNCYSWMYVVANYNNTLIEITPSVKTYGGKPAGVPFQVTLNKGQIYQILGANAGVAAGGAATNDGLELTGTTVKSLMSTSGYIFPIAVFSGSSRTNNPASCGSGGGDNDIQQHFPRQAWGKYYLTAPTTASSAVTSAMTNTYKITVTDPTTVIKRNGVTLTGLVNNTYYTYESSTADYIEGDKPILVAQFMTGGFCSGTTALGDPEMFYLSPISQATKKSLFMRNTVENITYNYLTLIIPTAGLSSLMIDNSTTTDYVYSHPNKPGYSVVVKKWNAAKAQVLVQSDSAFNGITYGLGSVESYGYNIGTNLNAVAGREVSIVPLGFGSLPVDLMDFSVSRFNNDIAANWIAINETNLDRFEVERSLNGNDFVIAGTVPAIKAGLYSLSDKNAAKDFSSVKVLYYRLKMVDKDGSFKYSSIVSVKLDKNKSGLVSVYPNPFVNEIKVRINTENAGLANVSIKDLSGRLVESQSSFVPQGSNLVSLANLAKLEKGIYVLSVEINGNNEYFKLLK